MIAGLEPKLFILKSSTQQQSYRAHTKGQFCHQDRPSICLCSKVRDCIMTTFQLAPKSPKVAVSGFCKFGSFQPNLTLRQLDWSTMMFIEGPFIWYPTCLIFALVVWWSMTSCTARKTLRRRPGRRLILGYITSVDVFFYRSWWVMLVDMRVFFVFNMSDHIKYMKISGWRHHERQGHLGGEDQGGRWH